MLLDHYRPSTGWTPGRCIPDPVVVGGMLDRYLFLSTSSCTFKIKSDEDIRL